MSIWNTIKSMFSPLNLVSFGLITIVSLGFFIYALLAHAQGPSGWQWLMLLVSVTFAGIWFRVGQITATKNAAASKSEDPKAP